MALITDRVFVIRLNERRMEICFVSRQADVFVGLLSSLVLSPGISLFFSIVFILNAC
jgi:hypothetical protein